LAEKKVNKLSSQYCLTDKPQVVPFYPEQAALTKYPITTFQPLYFLTESFQQAKAQIIQFTETLNRPFSVRYNPYTQTVEILDTKQKLGHFVKEIQTQISTLAQAISKLPVGD
jgi:phenylalanine-4-hydroxylase